MTSKYRKAAIDGFVYSDLEEYGYDDNRIVLVPADDVENVINKIESDVEEIASLLDSIEGLSEIDEVKEKLNDLVMKLY